MDEAIALIGEKTFEDLCILDLIREGATLIEDNPHKLFHITEKGDKQIKSAITKPTKELEEIGDYLISNGW